MKTYMLLNFLFFSVASASPQKFLGDDLIEEKAIVEPKMMEQKSQEEDYDMEMEKAELFLKNLGIKIKIHKKKKRLLMRFFEQKNKDERGFFKRIEYYSVSYSEEFQKNTKYAQQGLIEEINFMVQAFHQWILQKNKMVAQLGWEGMMWGFETLHQGNKPKKQKEFYGSYAIKSRSRGGMEWTDRVYVDLEGEKIQVKNFGHIPNGL